MWSRCVPRSGTPSRRSPRSSGRPPLHRPLAGGGSPSRRWSRSLCSPRLIAVPFVARRSGGSSEIAPNSIGILDPESGDVTATIGARGAPGVGRSFGGRRLGDQPRRRDRHADRSERAGGSRPYPGRREPDRDRRRVRRRVGRGQRRAVRLADQPRYERRSCETIRRSATARRASRWARGAVWVTNRFDGTISRIDPDGGEVVETIPVGLDPRGIAIGFGSVWVGLAGSNEVVRVDPQTNAVTQPIGVGNAPGSLAVSADAVWVANTLDDTVSRINPDTNSVGGHDRGRGRPLGDRGRARDRVGGERSGRDALADRARSDAVRPLVIGSVPQGLAGVNGDLWVSVRGTATSHRGGTLRMVSAATGLERLTRRSPTTPSRARVLHLLGDGLVAFEPIGGANAHARARPGHFDTDADRRRSNVHLRVARRASDTRTVRSSRPPTSAVPSNGVSVSTGAIHAALYGGLVGGEACVERASNVRPLPRHRDR